MNAPPIRFVLGLHLHQPVGNFDHVFAQHVDDVYAPLLDALEREQFFPVVLHVSGPLLEWLDEHASWWLDRVAALVRAGRIEPLLSGFDEPVLASLPRQDRLEQIVRMADAVERRLGARGIGLWLTERVWEPDLAADLAMAGIKYALVDDRHFLVTGFEREQLFQPWITENDGRTVALFPIDQRLRYLIPFRPPEETTDYLRELRSQGHRLAVFADDGEKFGGWPGTKEWVYDQGWLARFMTAIRDVVASGEVQLSTFADALRHVSPGGLAYLGTASYMEMEGWSLPPAAAGRLAQLQADLGARLDGPDSALVRGSHWKNFFAKYTESNRMHKTMQRVSTLCRARGDRPEVRRLVGRAQCNDAYWHGVFGGLYLPHLREGIWKNLALAEGALRVGEDLIAETLDVDCDGADELLVTSSRMMAVISPTRGGAIETYLRFADQINYADVLTRRHEASHDAALAEAHAAEHDHDGGMPSIHDIETQNRLSARPPVDQEPRAISVERILADDLSFEAYVSGAYPMRQSWARTAFHAHHARNGDDLIVTLTAASGPWLEKTIHFHADGTIALHFRWDPRDGVFTTELSLFRPLEIDASPAADVWRFAVETVAKSERGLDHTVQGESVALRWPAADGAASLSLR